MNYTEKYREYLEYLENIGNKSELKQSTVYSKVGEYDYTDCDEEFVKQVIISCNPKKGEKSINPIKQVIINFAKFIGDNRLEYIARNINRKQVWNEVKENAEDRYISHKEFEYVLKKIFNSDDVEPRLFNLKYYVALFWCTYEGIYNGDYSLISNLRTCNINKRTVTTYDNEGVEHKFILPKRLINLLIDLGEENIWETTNANQKMSGKYSDSCFKICQRKKKKSEDEINIDESYRNFYLDKLGRINEKYIKRKLSSQEIYVSGIMHRIILRANKEGVSLQDIFKPHNRNPLHNSIILQELRHSNYHIPIKNFREMVKDYLYVFDEEYDEN